MEVVVEVPPTKTKDKLLPRTDDTTYTVEIAKSGRAQCKKCEKMIANKTIRVGLQNDTRFGLFTKVIKRILPFSCCIDTLYSVAECFIPNVLIHSYHSFV